MNRSNWLNEDDAADLFMFASQADDDDADGYTVQKERMKRLAALGVVQHHGFGRYSLTSFGQYLINEDFEQAQSLPLKTTKEANDLAREKSDLRLCTNVLRSAGSAYPRTCQVCGLGPCRNPIYTGKGL